MSNFNRHKKIYYVPGIISLMLIPWVLWHYGTEYIERNDFRVLYFNMPPKYHYEEFSDFIAQIKFNSSPINVPPNFSDKTELDYLKVIEDLKNKNVDKTGIKFQLTEENTYGDLVKLLNLMKKTEHARYGLRLDKNSFEVININYVDHENVVICGGVLGFPSIKKETGFVNHLKEFLQSLPNYTYPIIIGYLIYWLFAQFSVQKSLSQSG